jgi:hypothetical protein
MKTAELMCDNYSCPAGIGQRVEIDGVELKFCQHHFNKYEPLFVAMLDTDNILIDA